MSALLFANETVIVLSYDGETFRVDTAQMRTATLLQAASELLSVAAERMRCVKTDSTVSPGSDSSLVRRMKTTLGR